jgi:hypothetical protein
MKGNPMAITTRRAGPLAGLAAVALLLAACGGDDTGGGGGAASAGPAQAQVTITQADTATPFQLEPGRYRFGWNAPDCTNVDFTLTGQTQGFTYSKKSSIQKFQSIVSDVPADTYTLAQNDASCTAWTVVLDRIGA